MTASIFPSSDDVVAAVTRMVFGKTLITNVQRGAMVEAIVDLALNPSWTFRGDDYAPWDFDRSDNVRVQVKQSAAQQSWDPEGKRATNRRTFSIGRRFKWEDSSGWSSERERWAAIYVFAHHSVVGSNADQRDPSQWAFYVIEETRLPSGESIALSKVRALCPAVRFDQLRSTLNLVADRLPTPAAARTARSAPFNHPAPSSPR